MAVSTTPRRIIQPPSWKHLVDLDEATAVTGLTAAQLEAAVDERDVYLAGQLTRPGSSRVALRRHIPNPAERAPLRWRRGPLTLWALRLGIYPRPFEGVDVIGYTGLALLFDVEEQSLRKLVANPEEHAPGPVFEIDRLSLFDRAAMRQWGIKVGPRLAPDGVTPTRLRPRRN